MTRKPTSVPQINHAAYKLDIFNHADFRNRHEGLALMARGRNIDVDKLEAGHYVVFVNSARNTIWLYAQNGVLSGRKLPKGETLDLRSILYIVNAFRATGRFEYDEGVNQFVRKHVGASLGHSESAPDSG